MLDYGKYSRLAAVLLPLLTDLGFASKILLNYSA